MPHFLIDQQIVLMQIYTKVFFYQENTSDRYLHAYEMARYVICADFKYNVNKIRIQSCI